MKDLLKGARLFDLCGVKFSLKALAPLAQVSVPYLSLILSGQRQPPQATLQRIARALGVDVVRLVRELRKRNGKQ